MEGVKRDGKKQRQRIYLISTDQFDLLWALSQHISPDADFSSLDQLCSEEDISSFKHDLTPA